MKKINIPDLAVLLGLSILLCFFACSTKQNSKQKVLRHVVSFQFNEDISEERKAQAVQDFFALKDEIPEIKKFEGGENINEQGLNKGFTHWFVLTFENEAARDIYLPHPAHQRVVEKNKPLFKDLLVVDYWGEE